MDLKGAAIRNIYQFCSNIRETGVDSKLFVRIPHYQRPYKWGREQIELLFNDFFEQNKVQNVNHNSEYFAGSMVTVQSSKEKHHELIDGQQRITTVFLVNFLKFLLLRSLAKTNIELYIKTYDIINIIDNTGKTYEDYVHAEHIEVDKIKRIFKFYNDREKVLSAQKRDRVREGLNKIFNKVFKLPNLQYEDEMYIDTYRDNIFQFFNESKNNLNLFYARDSLNEILKDSLANCTIQLSNHALNFKHPECNKDKDSLKNNYIETIKTAFDFFYNRAQHKNPVDKVEYMIKEIDFFLKNVKFCVIQTGNVDDAFKLFEVLNDRSLALNDLDLIKNLFYKTYYHKCDQSISEDEKDRNIGVLESMWSDKIFSDNTIHRSKFIAYCGTVYLTGSKEIDFEKNTKYRKAVEMYLLKYNNNDQYNIKNAISDFNIYYAVKLLIKRIDLAVNKRVQSALIVENNPDYSLTYKTICFLNALKQEGVMASIFNIILRTYFDMHGDFDIEKFEEFVKEIKYSTSHADEKYKLIHAKAQEVWKIAMLAPTYENPRKFSKRIIDNINHNKYEPSNTHPADTETESKTFREKMYSWRKNNSTEQQDLKIKILFLRLYQSAETEKSTIKSFKNASSLELDHIEPQKVGDNKFEYFTLENESERDNFIHQIGNFMLLPKDDNTSKGNTPAYKYIDEYANKMLNEDHWLVKNLKDLFDTHGTDVGIDCGDQICRKIPKQEFFTERTKYLIEAFLENINKDILSS